MADSNKPVIIQKCIWCPSEKTYLMGEDGWYRYFHCGSCHADFPINMQDLAWTSEEIETQRKIEEAHEQ